MKNQLRIFFVIFSLFSVSLSGCIESADVPSTELQGETLAEVQNPRQGGWQIITLGWLMVYEIDVMFLLVLIFFA